MTKNILVFILAGIIVLGESRTGYSTDYGITKALKHNFSRYLGFRKSAKPLMGKTADGQEIQLMDSDGNKVYLNSKNEITTDKNGDEQSLVLGGLLYSGKAYGDTKTLRYFVDNQGNVKQYEDKPIMAANADGKEAQLIQHTTLGNKKIYFGNNNKIMIHRNYEKYPNDNYVYEVTPESGSEYYAGESDKDPKAVRYTVDENGKAEKYVKPSKTKSVKRRR